MEIFESVLGNAADEVWKERLAGADVDWLELSQWDAQKNRFRRQTKGGRSMAVALERGRRLRDGDILDWDEAQGRAVLCRIRLCPVMMLDMSGLAALPADEMLASAVRLGHALGNQHWPAVVRGTAVFVPVGTDKDVTAAVMDTHAVPGVSYIFLSGEDAFDLLDEHEARRLFGGAEQAHHAEHCHAQEPLFRHGFGREHRHGEEREHHGSVPAQACGPHGRRHRAHRHGHHEKS